MAINNYQPNLLITQSDTEGLVQNSSISSASALEILQCCPKPSSFWTNIQLLTTNKACLFSVTSLNLMDSSLSWLVILHLQVLIQHKIVQDVCVWNRYIISVINSSESTFHSYISLSHSTKSVISDLSLVSIFHNIWRKIFSEINRPVPQQFFP